MIRIGIIGCGKIAQVRHLPEYAANPHVELAGYYDLNTQRAQEMAAQYGGKGYDSYFDLLNDPSIDAVSICVENRSHAEITTYALYAGKHVLCEKPMAVTLAECESMVAAAERNDHVAAAEAVLTEEVQHIGVGREVLAPLARGECERVHTVARLFKGLDRALAVERVDRVVRHDGGHAGGADLPEKLARAVE